MDRLLTLSVVEHCTGFRKSSLYAFISNKKIPPPIKIGRSSRWLASEVQDWIYKLAKQNQQIEQSQKASVETR